MIDSKDRLSGLLQKQKQLDMKRYKLKADDLSNDERDKLKREINELVKEMES
jgi:hypothetical protein